MVNIYLTQLIGIMLTGAGILALMASAHLFGTPLTPADRRKASDEWNRQGNVYTLPINFSTLASIAIFLGGIGILTWTKFELCLFLGYWVPTLPEAIKLLLSCK
jgi:hypothetical protein